MYVCMYVCRGWKRTPYVGINNFIQISVLHPLAVHVYVARKTPRGGGCMFSKKNEKKTKNNEITK